jgi:Ni/Co efflux regulator RcnB
MICLEMGDSVPATEVMRTHINLVLTLAMLTGSVAIAQDRRQQGGQRRQETPQFSERDQQVTHDWYRQHQAHPPAGFRNQDRLSSEEESRLREGATLDKDLRKKVHSAPPDLSRQLPPPPSRHRYVAVGNHVALIDNGYNVKAVIHLHENR